MELVLGCFTEFVDATKLAKELEQYSDTSDEANAQINLSRNRRIFRNPDTSSNKYDDVIRTASNEIRLQGQIDTIGLNYSTLTSDYEVLPIIEGEFELETESLSALQPEPTQMPQADFQSNQEVLQIPSFSQLNSFLQSSDPSATGNYFFCF